MERFNELLTEATGSSEHKDSRASEQEPSEGRHTADIIQGNQKMPVHDFLKRTGVPLSNPLAGQKAHGRASPAPRDSSAEDATAASSSKAPPPTFQATPQGINQV